MEEDLELEAMASAKDDTLDATAPLLEGPRRDNTSPSGPGNEAGAAVSVDPSATSTATWFIWALTFAAGISGFLFGYEYVQACMKVLLYHKDYNLTVYTRTP